MNRLKLKICGMCHPANILSVAMLKPDYMGFIFYDKSPRYVGDHFQIPYDFPSDIRKVGVFVNQPINLVLDLAGKHTLDLIQFHGSESPDQCYAAHRQGFGVMKAFGVNGDFDMTSIQYYESAVDYFLFDAKGPGFGGHGKVFDWNLLEDYNGHIPFFLSGGLTPANLNLVESIKHPQLFGVDLNSGVEEKAGYKSTELVTKAMENCSK